MERNIRQSFDDINKMSVASGSGVSFEVQEYDRGFSSSRIEWKIRLGELNKVYGMNEIIFLDRADHGLTGIVSFTSLEKNKWFADLLNKELDGKNPLEIKTEYSILGGIKTTLTMDRFFLKSGNQFSGNQSFEMMPGNGLITINKDLNGIGSEFTWSGCRVPGKFNMGQFSGHLKLDKIIPYIWDGTASFALKDINIKNPDKPFSLTGLTGQYASNFNEKENALSMKVRYGVDSIKSGSDEVKNASVRMALNKIDASGYQDFMMEYTRMMSKIFQNMDASLTGSENISDAMEKQLAGLGLQMTGAYEKLLKKGLEIQVSDLKAQLPKGEIKADVTLSLKQDMTMAGLFTVMWQPSRALDIFSLTSDIHLPYLLTGNNSMLLSPIYDGMQTGLFIKNGDVLSHKAQIRDGKLYLNEKEVLLN